MRRLKAGCSLKRLPHKLDYRVAWAVADQFDERPVIESTAFT